MVEAYPELQGFADHLRKSKWEADEIDGIFRYLAVLCGPTKGKSFDDIAEDAKKQLDKKSGVALKQGVLDRGLQGLLIRMWFETFFDARTATWFALRSALLIQNQYLMSPINPDGDIEKQADTRKKVSKEVTGLMQQVEVIEQQLFSSVEVKSRLNEELSRHQFAGYPEAFALARD